MPKKGKIVELENGTLSKQISPLALSLTLHALLIVFLLTLNYHLRDTLSMPQDISHQKEEATIIFADEPARQQDLPQSFVGQAQGGGPLKNLHQKGSMPEIVPGASTTAFAQTIERMFAEKTEPQKDTQDEQIKITDNATNEEAPETSETTTELQNSPITEEKNTAKENSLFFEKIEHTSTSELPPPTNSNVVEKKIITLKDIGQTFQKQLAQESTIASAGKGDGTKDWHAGAHSSMQIIADRTKQIAFDNFIFKVGKQIESHFNFNKMSFPVSHKITIRLLLNVTFNPNGSIHALYITESSGYRELDTFIEKIMRQASTSFPKLPDCLGNQLTVRFFVNFKDYVPGSTWTLSLN